MLIKVNTVVYIDKDRGYIPCGPAIINTDKIFDITPNQDETAWFIEMGDERHRHIVTATEFARLQPLLIPAPVSDAFEQSAEKAQRQVPGEWQTTFDAYLARWYALKQSGADMAYTLPAQQAFNDAYATLLSHCATGYKAASVSEPSAPILPSRVFEAYNDLNDAMTETDYDKLYQAVDRLCTALRPTIKAQHYGYSGYGEQGDMEEVRTLPLPAKVMNAWNTYNQLAWDSTTQYDKEIDQQCDHARAMFLTIFGDFVKETQS